MDLRDIGWKGRDWVSLAHDSVALLQLAVEYLKAVKFRSVTSRYASILL
jgi:hypothetical protein